MGTPPHPSRREGPKEGLVRKEFLPHPVPGKGPVRKESPSHPRQVRGKETRVVVSIASLFFQNVVHLFTLGHISGSSSKAGATAEEDLQVFISYQWDMQSKVEDIRRILDANHLTCWADINSTGVSTSSASVRGRSSISSRSSSHHPVISSELNPETLLSQIQRSMRSACVVISCITPKYLQSDNCIKDLTLAESLGKPIIPVMLRFCPWPPDGAPVPVRKILIKYNPVDLSGEKLFKQNMPVLIDRIRKCVDGKAL